MKTQTLQEKLTNEILDMYNIFTTSTDTSQLFLEIKEIAIEYLKILLDDINEYPSNEFFDILEDDIVDSLEDYTRILKDSLKRNLEPSERDWITMITTKVTIAGTILLKNDFDVEEILKHYFENPKIPLEAWRSILRKITE
jgi:hypothetical protein